MAGRYLLIRRKTSKAFVGAVPIKPKVSSATVLKVARKSIKPGLLAGPIVNSSKLREIVLKQRPRRKIVKKRATKRRK